MALLMAILSFLGGVGLFAGSQSMSAGSTAPRPYGAPMPTRAPMLDFARFRPLVVRGTGFDPRERVRVTSSVRRSETARRVVTASAAGAFTLRLPAVGPCREVSVHAVGSSGSEATTVGEYGLCRK